MEEFILFISLVLNYCTIVPLILDCIGGSTETLDSLKQLKNKYSVAVRNSGTPFSTKYQNIRLKKHLLYHLTRQDPITEDMLMDIKNIANMAD